ncbi:uncharacterized protein LOC121686464 [Alosa sapidissima]|uniref:uncharacterized protein LOC121686464 n=1 Tax=Alosa sapidissima TaxID=34773 RepID=UPI001C091567|nr:uncharacterized protein LOC121686464 [Alosa sapidissima]
MARVISSERRITEQYCLHVLALKQVVEDFDRAFGFHPSMHDYEHSYASADASLQGCEEVFHISERDVCVKAHSGQYGVVRCGTKRACLTCPSTSCGHVGELHRLLSTSPDKYEDIRGMCLEDAPSEANGTFKCLSSRPIAFRPVPGSVRHSPGYNAQSHLPMILRDRACTMCGTPIVETQLSTAVEVPLITRNFVFDYKDLFSKAEAPFLGEELVDDSPVDHPSEASLSFFPSLPVIRQRGHYLADSKQSKPACHKNASGHPSLLPGVFLIHCEHGICYGFQMMVKHESPDTPFTVLKTRFMEMPKVVIYDNSCNLHQYCLNRDRLSFKKTWFLVDRLHWKNHRR